MSDILSEANAMENEVNTGAPEISEIPVQEEKKGFGFDFGWLKAPTASGSVEERIEHPLNFAKSKGLARVIRGFEGILGNLNLAIIDIALGLLEFLKERKAASDEPTSRPA